MHPQGGEHILPLKVHNPVSSRVGILVLRFTVLCALTVYQSNLLNLEGWPCPTCLKHLLSSSSSKPNIDPATLQLQIMTPTVPS